SAIFADGRETQVLNYGSRIRITPDTSEIHSSTFVSFSEPDGVNDTHVINSLIELRWTSSQPDHTDRLTFYYHTTDNGSCSDGKHIGTAHENGSLGSIFWNTSGVPVGVYYTCTVIHYLNGGAEDSWAAAPITLLPVIPAAITSPTGHDD